MSQTKALWLKTTLAGVLVTLAFPITLMMGSYVNAGYGLSVKHDQGLEFEWQDTQAKTHAFSDLESEAVYLMMGFFSCSEACPLRVHQLQQLSQQLDAKHPNSSVRFFMITIDPINEPADLRERYFASLSDRFISASLDETTLRRLQYQLGERVRKMGDTLSHAGQLYLLNKDKELVRIYSQLAQPKGALYSDLTTTDLLRSAL